MKIIKKIISLTKFFFFSNQFQKKATEKVIDKKSTFVDKKSTFVDKKPSAVDKNDEPEHESINLDPRSDLSDEDEMLDFLLDTFRRMSGDENRDLVSKP